MLRSILLVDDDQKTRLLLKTYLEKQQYEVHAAHDGGSFLSAFEILKAELSLVILDVMLPDTDGFTLCKTVRQKSKVPIIMLTASADETDRIVGLEIGADDYIAKPYNPRELLARIKAILRRTMQEDDEILIRAGEISMDQDTHEVRVGDHVLDLSPTEFKLLRYMMLNPNRVLSKAQILDHVWEYDFNGDAGIVESYISYLRRKIDPVASEPLIQTKRGFGYMLKIAKAS